MEKIFAILVLSLMFFSCGKTVLNAELGKEISLSINQDVDYDDTDLKLKINDVKEDSRCPVGTNCIWEGRVVLNVLVNDIFIPVSSQKKIDTLGYSFSITEVLPVKTIDEIPAENYIIKLLVTK